MQAREISIQEATQNDLPRLFEISSIVHLTNYTELIPKHLKKNFFAHYEPVARNRNRYVSLGQRKINNPNYTILTATLKQGIVVGYISGEKLDDGSFKIRSLFVDPSCQRGGIGTSLMGEIINRHGKTSTHLMVIKGNRAAISLYEKYGFKVSQKNTKKHFFGAPLLRMSRDGSERRIW